MSVENKFWIVCGISLCSNSSLVCCWTAMYVTGMFNPEMLHNVGTHMVELLERVVLVHALKAQARNEMHLVSIKTTRTCIGSAGE